MLQVPFANTVVVPSTVVPFGAYKVIVSPGVPVPLMAGLLLLVRLSVWLLPVSLIASGVKSAVNVGIGVVVAGLKTLP